MNVMYENYDSIKSDSFNGISFFAENADCHDWNKMHNVIASDLINHNTTNFIIH